MSPILVFLGLSLTSVAFLYWFFIVRPKQRYIDGMMQDEDEAARRKKNDGEQEEQKQPRRGAAAGIGQRVRNRRRNQIDEEDDENDEVQQEARQPADDQDDIDAILNDPDRKLTKKEIAKLQKKQEKQRMQEALKQQREEIEQRRAEREAKEQEQEDKRKQEEEEQKELERKKKEEAEQQEREEYNKWKDMFTVEAAGDQEEEDQEYENKLQQFIDYIVLRKVVLFEDLAAEFGISTKDVIDRIQRLQESGRLQGITDDRGKFIHITEQEYESIARYIKTRGRVGKADLLMECNKLVRLQPRNEDKVKIQQEQKKALEKVESEMREEEPKA